MSIYHYLHEAVDSYREKMVATRFAMITYAIPYVFFGSLAVGISLIAGAFNTSAIIFASLAGFACTLYLVELCMYLYYMLRIRQIQNRITRIENALSQL